MRDPLVWETYWRDNIRAENDPSRGLLDGGEWIISRVQKYEPWEIKFRPPMPPGTDWFEESTRIGLMEDRSPEYMAAIRRRVQQDLGYAYTRDWAQELVERYRDPSYSEDKSKTLREILREGMGIYSESYPNWYQYSMRKGSFTVSTGEGDREYIHATYQPKNATRWHNVLRMNYDFKNFDGTKTLPTYYPEGCDPHRVAARMIVDEILPWFINNRVPRGH